MKILFYTLRIPILILMLTINACSLNIIAPQPVTNIYFPKLKAAESSSSMEAAFYGVLEVKGKCLGFNRGNGSFTTFTGWPHYLDLMRVGDEIHIIKDGMSIVKVGDYLEIGGGAGHTNEQTDSDNLPCLPPYWIVGELPVPSLKKRIIYKLTLMGFL